MLSPEETIAALNEEDLAEEAQVEVEALAAHVLVRNAFDTMLDEQLGGALASLAHVLMYRLRLRGIKCANDEGDAAAWAIEHCAQWEDDGDS